MSSNTIPSVTTLQAQFKLSLHDAMIVYQQLIKQSNYQKK